ncbi:MAG: hypothetical protein ACRC6V_06910 [Bacteroidales bacterium]
MLQANIIFQRGINSELVGYVHLTPNSVIGVRETDTRPKTIVFLHPEHANVQIGRVYRVDLSFNFRGNCYIAKNPNPEICWGTVELESDTINVKVGKSTLSWCKNEPINKPVSFLHYVTNRKELKNKQEVFEKIVDCFNALEVDYIA